MPHRFAAIVPVSTEGDSREHLLRNLQHVPTYVLEGAQDRNIRGINGPRALGEILGRFAYDATYREFSDRAHEGFSELYPDVLRWAAVRPREPYPREILRLPHAGIMPLSRRVFWIESDTRQGVVRVKVDGDNHIEIESRWVRAVTLYLNDRIVDLDRPVEITVNGERRPPHQPRRSISTAIEQVRELGDAGRIATDIVTLDVAGGPSSAREGVAVGESAAVREGGVAGDPAAVREGVAAGEPAAVGHVPAVAAALWESLAPAQPEGQLSFWEFYAVNALDERFPTVGLEGDEVELDAGMREAMSGNDGGPPPGPRASIGGSADPGPESVGIAITDVDPAGPMSALLPGDVLLEVGGEPFFRGRGGLATLHRWLMRELTGVPKRYPIRVWRDGAGITTFAELSLGEYRSR